MLKDINRGIESSKAINLVPKSFQKYKSSFGHFLKKQIANAMLGLAIHEIAMIFRGSETHMQDSSSDSIIFDPSWIYSIFFGSSFFMTLLFYTEQLKDHQGVESEIDKQINPAKLRELNLDYQSKEAFSSTLENVQVFLDEEKKNRNLLSQCIQGVRNDLVEIQYSEMYE